VSLKNAGPTRRATVPDAPKLLKYEHWRSLGYDRESSKALVKFQNNLNGIINGTNENCVFYFTKVGTRAGRVGRYLTLT